jgi:uncharacterized delta-60 repeat protein
MKLVSLISRIGMILSIAGVGVDAQAAGNIDGSFANFGTARISGVAAYGPSAMVVRPGGHIVYAAVRPDFHDVVVGARNADGTEDEGFALGGLLPISTAGGSISQPVLGFDPVSKATVLAATDLTGGIYHLLLCRILDDGSLDPSFTLSNYPGQTGCIVTNPPAGAPNGLNVAGMTISQYGVITLGGTAFDFAHAPLFKAFYSLVQSGTVDVATQVLTVAANNVTITGLATDYNTGYSYMSGSIQLVDGSSNIDDAILAIRVHSVLGWSYNIFNTNLVTRGFDEGHAVAVRPDGKVVIVGVVDEASPIFMDCAIYQLTSDLNPDTSFGDAHNGTILTNFTGGITDAASCDAVAVDGENRVFVGGMEKRYNDADRDMVIARLTPSGAFDPTFGTIGPGISMVDPGDSASTTVFERVMTMGLQNGRAVVAGPSEPPSGATPSNSDMIIVRLADEDFIFAHSFE